MEERSFIRPRSYFVGATALVAAGLVLGLGLSASLNLPRSSHATNAQLAAATNSAPLPASPFANVVARALPAVVFIDVRKQANAGDDSADELMRRYFGQQGQQGQRHPQRTPSSGSGFIIDKKGHIITNNHVVSNADEINVTLADGREFKARTIGADPETDVAVIQIDGPNLPTLPLGDSDKLRVGDWAIAIGNPLGELRGSVTVGIVSAQGRTNLNIYGGTPGYQDFIQTDASINFGNSGGPLCNIRGEAVGINTAINTSGQGIGFAVPINLAKHVAEQLVAHGAVRRAQLGVFLAEMTPEVAEGFGLAGQKGVLISRVVDGSPAALAGLQRNDVIVEFDGQPVTDLVKLRLRVADASPGRTVGIVVLREGRRTPVSVTLEDREKKVVANAEGQRPDDAKPNLGGLTVRDLRDVERKQLGLESGVLVTDVEDGSIADDKGIAPNDVIEMVGGKPATDAATFGHLLAAAKLAGRPAVLYVNRAGVSQYVPMRLDK